MKTGLVLEGGGMRGLFTAGVLDVFWSAGLRFDGIIGVSAGACFGCNYKSHQPGRVLRYNKRLAKDPRYCSLASLFRTGDLFGAEFCYHELPERIDPFDREAFAEDPTAFYCVTTDCASGEAVYHRIDQIDYEELEWIRASASMPVVARPVPLAGRLHLDGGLSDGIPLKYFEGLGYGRNVVITTRPHGYRKFPSWKYVLARPFLRTYPKVYEAMRNRYRWYNETLAYIDRQVAAGAVVLIAPESELPIRRICHSPAIMQQAYDLGQAAGEKALCRLRM